MFAAVRRTFIPRLSTRAFASTPARSYDLAKLVLVGRMGKNPELRTTKNGSEYYHYTVATTNFPPPPPNPDGTRASGATTWHTILSFNENANHFLRNVKRGSQVYVESNYEVREPDHSADAETPQGQRQIFLRHETIRVLSPPHSPSTPKEEED